MITQFLSGWIMMGCAACGLFFLRTWRETRDQLFAKFAAAFWLLAVERLVLAVLSPAHEMRPYVFIFRLLAFATILLAIFRKNRLPER